MRPALSCRAAEVQAQGRSPEAGCFFAGAGSACLAACFTGAMTFFCTACCTLSGLKLSSREVDPVRPLMISCSSCMHAARWREVAASYQLTHLKQEPPRLSPCKHPSSLAQGPALQPGPGLPAQR